LAPRRFQSPRSPISRLEAGSGSATRRRVLTARTPVKTSSQS
jgi:hypothetical protein